MAKIKKQEALDYHASDRPGKIEVIPTKPYSSQRDLSLAYSPGVAEPCLKIAENKSDVYKYTAKGNLVAVISNGTAVLGLGNIGPEASKPVMEGKGLLFKIFADIDVFDIEVDATDIDHFVSVVKAIAPTFGGINLEDIKAPEAFEIERRLKAELDIPIMHDDQHGTAIVSGAALTNALQIANKKAENVKVVVSGAGAAAISCLRLYLALGVKKENIFMFDSKGLITTSRADLDETKIQFATTKSYASLAEAMKGADVFLGLSKGGVLTKSMVMEMAEHPIIFALANPDPEISYTDAKSARPDAIVATGRSDFPNQVNNVLCFPFLFRGALDVRANCINEEMKLAAVHAIAGLAKEPVSDEVNEAYGLKKLAFGREFIIPKPLDKRLITWVAPAVAKAAMDSGVAKNPIKDWDNYNMILHKRLGLDNMLMKGIIQRARQKPQRVVFAEADNYKILKAAQLAEDEGFIKPILLGNENKIKALIKEYGLDFTHAQIIDTRSDKLEQTRLHYADILFAKRQRKGVTLVEARKSMQDRNFFGSAMVEAGDADAMISGLTRNYPETIRPALQVIGMDEGVKVLAGMYIISTKQGPLFIADTTINYNPTAEQIVEITTLVAKIVRKFKVEPNIALLSYSNFGSSRGAEAKVMAEAAAYLHKKHPELVVDGELQANFAMNTELLNEIFPFSVLANKPTNVLIFPNLSAGNIAYKLFQSMTEYETIGPVLLGLKKPVHVLQLGSSVREIFNMIAIAAVDALTRK